LNEILVPNNLSAGIFIPIFQGIAPPDGRPKTPETKMQQSVSECVREAIAF
jgi:hypothetical protein